MVVKTVNQRREATASISVTQNTCREPRILPYPLTRVTSVRGSFCSDPRPSSLCSRSDDRKSGGGEPWLWLCGDRRDLGACSREADDLPRSERVFFCGYDDRGDLFADGITSPGSGHFGLAELAKGKTALTQLGVEQYLSWPGGVQWDGQYLAVGDANSSVIYRFVIRRDRAITGGEVRMRSGARSVAQFWIQSKMLIAPNTIPGHGGLGSKALIYRYSRGGKAVKKISKGIIDAQGAVVSQVQE